MADAEALATRYADRPGVMICCGSPEKLTAEPPYDTVVALDGLSRLCTAEGAELAWGETFELLVGALRPGGQLLLGVENHLGLHRLVALPPEVTDSDWVVTGEHDPTRPAGPARVRARLRAAGLDLTRSYAAYPTPTAPLALVGEEILADESTAGFLAATLSRVCAPMANVLTEPDRLAVDALRHGVAAELAPAWILLARRGPATATEPPSATGLLPEVLVADGPDRWDIRRDVDGRWTRRLAGAAGAEAVPSGRTLDDLLLAGCLRRDLPAVRELLGAWQSAGTWTAGGPGAWPVPPGPRRCRAGVPSMIFSS
ncbi:hypothetical protein JNW88_16820, partial [Micromonospora sp. ATA32]|nr:hypothetical protein [Micromonospora sp. ATA32]